MSRPALCRFCGEDFNISAESLAFYKKISPVFSGKEYTIPPPTACPACRLRRRLAFRNQIYVYSRRSSLTEKSIFSMFTENAQFPVVEKEFWWSDQFDALEYGRDVDFSRSFFDQFVELRNQVPHFPLSVLNMENSDYCNNAGGCKNCYFVFNATDSEDCMFCDHAWYSRDCLECTSVQRSELCYDCVYCHSCYNLQSSQFCENCSDSYFLSRCQGCRNCFGCVNLLRAEHCVFNKQLTKDEYQRFLSTQNLSSYSAREVITVRCREFAYAQPSPHLIARMAENCSGNLLNECSNVSESFHVTQAENILYGYLLHNGVRDCQDYSMFGNRAELIYECSVCGIDAYNLKFCFDCWSNVSNLTYCMLCVSAKNLFGCVGLRNKEFCILNKEYSKSEYNTLVPRIILHMVETGEWGEFFPESLAPIPYNRSLAQRYFPRSKEEIDSLGLTYYEPEFSSSMAQAIPAAELPDTLPEDDSTLTVLCARTGKPFRITAQEVKKLRKFGGVLPRYAYDERMTQRDKLRGGVTLRESRCAKTGKIIYTALEAASFPVLWNKVEYDREFGYS